MFMIVAGLVMVFIGIMFIEYLMPFLTVDFTLGLAAYLY